MRQTVAGRGARGRSKRGENAHSKSQARRATKRHPPGPGLASISPHVSRERPLPAQVTQGARRCPTAGRPPLAQVTEGVRLYPTAAGRPSLARVTGGVRLYPTAGRPSLAQITGGGGGQAVTDTTSSLPGPGHRGGQAVPHSSRTSLPGPGHRGGQAVPYSRSSLPGWATSGPVAAAPTTPSIGASAPLPPAPPACPSACGGGRTWAVLPTARYV